MKRLIIITALLLSLTNVYSNDKTNPANNIEGTVSQYDKLIELARTYLDKNTEYAFNCVYKAHGIAEDNNDSRKSAECNIIMGDIFKKSGSYPTAINYYETAIEKLDVTKEYHTIYKLYINIAKLHQSNEINSKWSIDAMNNAMEYGKIINETAVLNDIHMAYGDLYFSRGEYESAEKHYDEILKNNIDKSTILPISITLTKKADILIHKNRYEDALCMVDSSLYLCIRNLNDSLQIINYSYKAQIYDSINDFESAKKYYNQSTKLAYSAKDYYNCAKNMLGLAHLNQRNGKYDKAIEVFKTVCDSTSKFRMFDICHQSYYQLSKCYASLGQYEKAYEYFDKYDIYSDSTSIQMQEEKINKLHNSYILSLSANELKAKIAEEENAKSAKKELALFISIIIVLMMISTTLIILHTSNRTIYNKNKITTYEQQLKIDKIESDLKEYKLKNYRELIIKLAIQLRSYVEIINPVRSGLKSYIDLPDNEQKSKIKELHLHLQNNIHIFNNTDNLNKQINAIYKDFLDNLETKHPGLTKSEKKLCTMLYVNMSSKEIATMTNTTIRTIETSRYRLRKKFGLSRDEDIVSFLQKI